MHGATVTASPSPTPNVVVPSRAEAEAALEMWRLIPRDEHGAFTLTCLVCGGSVERPRGDGILSRLYPGATFCRGCGRRQVHCTCGTAA